MEASLAVPAFSQWPTPRSPALAGVVDAIRARSKAFNYRTARFDIAVVVDIENTPTSERLNISLDNWHDNPDRLTFAFWEDEIMWLDARRYSKGGWEYEFSFYGSFASVEPSDVRDMIEQSLWITDQTEMELIWSRCNPTPG